MGKRNPAQVTLRDIAEATGYTVNTVSHALKDKTDISEQTRARIQQKAAEMGYIGNALAGSMRTGRTRTLALILGDIANPHFALIARDVEQTARDAGYQTILYNTGEDPEAELVAIHSALAHKADGLLLCPTQQSRRNLHYLKRCGAPFVLVGRSFDGEMLPGTVLDDESGGLLATRLLLAHGHRRILLLDGPGYISSAQLRRRGYERAFAEQKLTPPPELICPVAIEAGCTDPLAAIDPAHTPFSAIFAFSDMVALEAAAALQRRGLRVPEDVSIVGCDNIQAEFPVPVPLTSVCSAGESMAQSAARQLIALLMGIPQTKKILPVQLMLRDSVLDFSKNE